MGESSYIWSYALLFLPVLIVFAFVVILKVYSPFEKIPKPETHEKEIKECEDKASQIKEEISEHKEKIKDLKDYIQPVPDHSQELASLDQQINTYHEQIKSYKDTTPKSETPIKDSKQASEYLNSFGKVLSLIFLFIYLPTYAAKPIEPGEYVQVTKPSVILTVEEVENIRVSVNGLKEQNQRLASLTSVLEKKIELLESEKDIQDKDLSVYKKLTSEYEVTLVKFTEQVTELETALELSKKDTLELEETNKKLEKSLRTNKRKSTLMNYAMFILGAVIFKK